MWTDVVRVLRRTPRVRRIPKQAARKVEAETALTIVPLTGRSGVRMIGEADLSGRRALESALDGIPAEPGDVHLDLAELTFIDAGGVTLLVKKARQLGPGRRLVLHDPPRVLRRILGLLWGEPPEIELDMP
jgi:anti-anti-sigma regulatory factor